MSGPLSSLPECPGPQLVLLCVWGWICVGLVPPFPSDAFPSAPLTLHWGKKGSGGTAVFVFALGVASSGVQGFLLALHTGVTPGQLQGDPECQGSELGLPCARQASFLPSGLSLQLPLGAVCGILRFLPFPIQKRIWRPERGGGGLQQPCLAGSS